MVALQFLVLSVEVRILVRQLKRSSVRNVGGFFVYGRMESFSGFAENVSETEGVFSPMRKVLQSDRDRTGVLLGQDWSFVRPDWHSIRRESGLDQLDCSVEVAYFCHELCNFKIMLMLKSRLSLGKLAGFLCLLSCFTSLGAQEQAGSLEKPGWKLVWNDEFNYVGLPDPSKWSYDTDGNSYGWGNNELQYYTEKRKENAWVENGHLTIRALKEEMGGKSYTSARLRT